MHVVLDFLFWQVVSSTFDCVVEIHVHKFEHQGETTGGLIVKHFVELDDLGVGGKSSKSLNLS